MSPPMAPPKDREAEARKEAGVGIGLADDLRHVRTALVKAHLAGDFEAAFDLMLFQIGRSVFTFGYKAHARDIAVREAALADAMETAFAAGDVPLGLSAGMHAAALAWTPPGFAAFDTGRIGDEADDAAAAETELVTFGWTVRRGDNDPPIPNQGASRGDPHPSFSRLFH